MLTTESLSTDVVVIGSGVAGMMAALQARKGGAEVVLVSRAGLGKEASTAYAAASFRPPDVERGVNLPGFDNEPGKYIEDPSLVSAVDREALHCISLLEKAGVTMGTEVGYDGGKVYRPEGAGGTHGGAIILDILGPVLRDSGIRVIENCLVTALLKKDGRVTGAAALTDDGCSLSVHARATILAAGGAAGIYQNTTTSKGVLGSGYAMALQAGVHLTNVEFIHYYPVGLSTPSGQYVHCAPATLLMEKARLVNCKGEDIIQKHFHVTLQEGTVFPSTRFEWLPRAVAIEAEAGPVLLDLTQVSEKEWGRLPERNHKQIRRTGVDMRRNAVPVLHMGHSFRGGAPINNRGQTSIEGLYAAGEVASGYYAAENGWGPFPSCLITGAIAGKSAVADLRRVQDEDRSRNAAHGLEQVQALLGDGSGRRASELQEEVRKVFYRSAGPVKRAAVLEEGLGKLAPLEDAAQGLRCQDIAGLKAVLEIKAMLLVARAVMEAALFRKESRGAHYRRDFPARDDRNWLRPAQVSWDAASRQMKVTAGKSVAPEPRE